ncbi:MAG TPA: hydantoinase/carbamoylase family amidase [Tepidisphaeraceae bacterium]|nr:hydantoinase/carbamoylase family amidase [Tepidisphaeraceae bacterium]
MSSTISSTAGLDPRRTVAELKELRSLTGNADGAQRVAFTPTWAAARAFLREKLAALPVEVHVDAAGNMWATLKGKSDRELLMGGHIDSVPNGGWLDGCLNTLAGLEVLRRVAAEGAPPPVTVRLVDWCDEEGARFGRSLFGSSAASGALVPDEVRNLTDRDGIKLIDAARAHGIDLDRAPDARRELARAAAYLELHIEQGPVLESKGLPMGAVLGTFGVERHTIAFTGQAAHSGSTPMNHRRDALAGVSKLHLAVREIAARHGGVCTVGKVTTEPGIVTAVVGRAEMTLDQRHLDAAILARMYADARDASGRIASEEKIDVAWKKLWQIQPFPFHPELIEMADESIREVCGVSHRLPSGPLHDAAEVCRAGVPTVMLFVQSLRGISHNKIEDTAEAHLEQSVRALDRLASKAMRWIEQRPV